MSEWYKHEHTMNIRKQLRKTSADERAQERSKRSPQEQLAKLDQQLGKDVGAIKERRRLRHAAAKLVAKFDKAAASLSKREF